VEFVKERFAAGKNAYLACAAGTGKTIMATWALKDVGADNIVVLCPKILIPTWEKALSGQVAGYTPKNFVVMTYTAYKKWVSEATFLPKYIVADEAHYLSNLDAQRTKKFFEIKQRIDPRIIYLSATPFERPYQLFAICKHESSTLTNWYTYIRRYCGAYKMQHGWVYNGKSNLNELKEKLKEFMFFLGEGVHKLPPLSREIIIFKGDKKLQDAERQFLETFGDIDIDALLTGETSLISEYDTLAEARKEIGILKVPYVLDFIKATDSGEQVIIFAYHKLVIEELGKQLKCKTVYGGNTYKQNVAAIDEFSAGKAQYIVLSMLSASEGLTLTNAARAVFAEIPLTAKSFYQSSKRIHRISQDKPVNIQLLALDESFDHTVAKILVNKYGTLEEFGLIK
jgi:superfamily II DNA or RNA helicase